MSAACFQGTQITLRTYRLLFFGCFLLVLKKKVKACGDFTHVYLLVQNTRNVVKTFIEYLHCVFAIQNILLRPHPYLPGRDR